MKKIVIGREMCLNQKKSMAQGKQQPRGLDTEIIATWRDDGRTTDEFR